MTMLALIVLLFITTGSASGRPGNTVSQLLNLMTRDAFVETVANNLVRNDNSRIDTKEWSGYIMEDKEKINMTLTAVSTIDNSMYEGSGTTNKGADYQVVAKIASNGDTKFTFTDKHGDKATCDGKYENGKIEGTETVVVATGPFELNKTANEIWTGYWLQGEHAEIKFEITRYEIKGLDSKPGDLHGDGNSEIGAFTMRGSIESDNRVTMTLTYNDENKVTEEGLYNEEEGTIKGNWAIHNYHSVCQFVESKSK